MRSKVNYMVANTRNLYYTTFNREPMTYENFNTR